MAEPLEHVDVLVSARNAQSASRLDVSGQSADDLSIRCCDLDRERALILFARSGSGEVVLVQALVQGVADTERLE